MRRHILLWTLVIAVGVPVPAASTATYAFLKLKALQGSWDGRDDAGHMVRTTFKLVVADTVVMETLAFSGMEEMLTLYSLDGDSIALTHYCPTNNQPRMRAIPASDDPKQLVFSFREAGNLPNLANGHEHQLVIRFIDDDHIIERWTWRQDGKDTDVTYHFVRRQK